MAKTTTKAAAPAQMATDQPRQRQDVAVVAPPRLPYHPIYKERYGVDGMMWRALVEAVFPSAKTVEGIILAISYCKAKNYDIMKKMVNVVPIWNSQLRKEVEGVWEAVAALRATAFRTGEYAGCDETVFGPMMQHHFEGEVGRGDYARHVEIDLEFPQWSQITVYRFIQGQRCKFPGPKVYWLEAYGAQGKSDVPNDKWAEGGGSSYMLEKCTEAAALRKAFPEALGGTNSWEEMEGRKINIPPGQTIDHGEPTEPSPPRPTRESVRAANERTRQEQLDNEERGRAVNRETPAHNEETGEIEDGEDQSEEASAVGGHVGDRKDPDRRTDERADGGNGAQGPQSAQSDRGSPEVSNDSVRGQSQPSPWFETMKPADVRSRLIKEMIKASDLTQLAEFEQRNVDAIAWLAGESEAEHKKVRQALEGKVATYSTAAKQR